MVEESIEKLKETIEKKDERIRLLNNRVRSMEETLDSRAKFERLMKRPSRCCIQGCPRPACKPLSIHFTFGIPSRFENMMLDTEVCVEHRAVFDKIKIVGS